MISVGISGGALVRGLFLSILLAGSCAAAGASHPVLQALGVDAADVGPFTVLVRGARGLVEGEGLQVLGDHDGAFLVNADGAAVERLRARGASVVSFDWSRPPIPRSADAPKRIASPEANIQYLVDEVNWTDLRARTLTLEGYRTRYVGTDGNASAVQYLTTVFGNKGLAVETHSFLFGGSTHLNVIGVKAGVTTPEEIVIIGAHFDSYSSTPTVYAPGADDNASGMSAVLNMAKLFASCTFDRTIYFAGWNAEENGLKGSAAYAAYAASQGLNIVGVLNLDMLGWWTDGVDDALEIEANEASVWLMDLITDAADYYTPASVYRRHINNAAWWGDHASFWAWGYAGVNHEEAYDWADPDLNPNYHSASDLTRYLHQAYFVNAVRIAVAGTATLAGLVQGPVAVEGVPPSARARLTATPNPFNGRVAISVEGAEGRESIELVISDLRGRAIGRQRIVLEEGAATWRFDAHDASGGSLASGTYYVVAPELEDAQALRVVYVK